MFFLAACGVSLQKNYVNRLQTVCGVIASYTLWHSFLHVLIAMEHTSSSSSSSLSCFNEININEFMQDFSISSPLSITQMEAKSICIHFIFYLKW